MNRGSLAPSVPRRSLTARVELCFTDFMAREIVTGYTGAQMQCPSADGRSALPAGESPLKREVVR
jgi:hypothetical protein